MNLLIIDLNTIPKTNLLAVGILICGQSAVSILIYAMLMVYQFKVIISLKKKLLNLYILLSKLLKYVLAMYICFCPLALFYGIWSENINVDIFFTDAICICAVVIALILFLRIGKEAIQTELKTSSINSIDALKIEGINYA